MNFSPEAFGFKTKHKGVNDVMGVQEDFINHFIGKRKKIKEASRCRCLRTKISQWYELTFNIVTAITEMHERTGHIEL